MSDFIQTQLGPRLYASRRYSVTPMTHRSH